MNSSKLTAAVAAATIAAQVLLPAVASAATVGGRMDADVKVRAEGNAPTGAAACTFITAHTGTMLGRLDELNRKLDTRRGQRDSNLSDRRENRGDKLTEVREHNNDRRLDLYAALDARATTDAQHAAVASFKASVEASVAARKAAVDAANAAYKAGIDKAIADRKAKVDAALTAFEASVKAAFEKAQMDCEAGVSRETLRASLKASLDAAKTKLETDRKAIEKTGETAKALAETRRKAIDKAFGDFKVAMEKARATLKAAFPKKVEASGSVNVNASAQ